jgi:hypothetical protein
LFDFTRRAVRIRSRERSRTRKSCLTAYILRLNNLIGENDVMNANTLPKVACRTGMASSVSDKMP